MELGLLASQFYGLYFMICGARKSLTIVWLEMTTTL